MSEYHWIQIARHSNNEVVLQVKLNSDIQLAINYNKAVSFLDRCAWMVWIDASDPFRYTGLRYKAYHMSDGINNVFGGH